MEYILLCEPKYPLECIHLLMAVFGGKTMMQARDESIEKYRGSIPEEAFIQLFNDAILLEDYVRQNLHFDYSVEDQRAFPSEVSSDAQHNTPSSRDMAEFLFTKRESTDNAPAVIFYYYDSLKANGIDDKRMAVIAYAIEDYFDEHDLESNPLGDFDDADFFNLVDSSGLDAATKFEVLQLYYRFDLYYACYTRVTTEVTALIKHKLPLFADKIEAMLTRLAEALAQKGALFFQELCGVEINNNDFYEIRPIIYTINSMGFESSRQIRSQINVGIHFIDLSELSKKAKSLKDSLLEFLKILSDNTKLSILQLLKEEPHYSGQIADKLKLTGATISYHMAALNKLELIHIRKEAVKVYYSLNNDKIKQYLDGLKTYLIHES